MIIETSQKENCHEYPPRFIKQFVAKNRSKERLGSIVTKT